MSLVLHELAGADPALRFSPHCWKIRMALAHKGLEAETRPWRFAEKDAIAFSGQGLVPVLTDGDDVVSDSWKIALHLEARHGGGALFPSGGQPFAAFVNAWADTALAPAIARIALVDIFNCLDEASKPYFRASRETRFGQSLEKVVADRPAHVQAFRQALAPLRRLLATQPFLCGSAPAYADYCVFGMFMWLRCVSAGDFLERDDPVHGWNERLLDAFGGLARRAPRAA